MEAHPLASTVARFVWFLPLLPLIGFLINGALSLKTAYTPGPSEPLSAVLLLGLGYDRLSVSPPALPLVKWVVRTVPEPAAARAAESALAAASAEDVSESLRSVVGEYIDVRLLDPSSALPGRGRVATLPPGKVL